MIRLCLTVAALAVLASCGPEPEMEWSQLAQAASSDVELPQEGLSSPKNVQALNGTSVDVGGPSPSGCDLGTASTDPRPLGCSNNGPDFGSPLAYVSLASVTAPSGSAVEAAALDGTRFIGRVNGVPVSGEDFVGAQFLGKATNGSTVQLRLDRAAPGRPGHSGRQVDVWRYDFSYLDAKGDWKRLCHHEHNKAVVVSGRWDYHQGYPGDGSKTNDATVFTIGCRRSAIEKCINAGYKPWASAGAASLDAHHQACVRMMRADYCGDGVSHTREGRKVNLYDRLGLLGDDEKWVLEAEWTPAGARCLNSLNLSEVDAPCAPLLGVPSCGETSSVGADTLIVSETPKPGGRDGH